MFQFYPLEKAYSTFFMLAALSSVLGSVEILINGMRNGLLDVLQFFGRKMETFFRRACNSVLLGTATMRCFKQQRIVAREGSPSTNNDRLIENY